MASSRVRLFVAFWAVWWLCAAVESAKKDNGLLLDSPLRQREPFTAEEMQNMFLSVVSFTFS